MCRLKSAIILKDRVYIPNHNSHSDMLKELDIADTQKNAEKLFVRAELTPKRDVFDPIDDWIYIVDQDILPDWYVEEYDKQRMIDAVKEWAKNHIHQNVNNLKITDDTHYCKNCTNLIIDGGTANISGGKANISGGTAHISGGKANIYGGTAYITGGTAYITGGTVDINGGKADIYGGVGIIPTDSSIDMIDITLYGDATLKDCRTKTIYQSGDWQYKQVDNRGDDNGD